MKKIIKKTIFGLICLIALNINAQTDYTYTLVDNGNFNYTVELVPTTTTSNFQTILTSYGFTITLPVGVTATFSNSLTGVAIANAFPGSAVGFPDLDGILVTEMVTGGLINIEAPSTGNTELITIQINGTPTSGEIAIAPNDSPLVLAVPSLESFLTADTVDNGMLDFTNNVSTIGAGVSGTSSIPFMTLSNEEFQFDITEIYPNPIDKEDSKINFKWSGASQSINMEIYDLNGRLVKADSNLLISSGVNTLPLSQMNSGLYLAKFTFENGNNTITKKIIVE